MLYRDGDYFGRDVNLASRVVARARGGEVLVTDSVVDAVRDSEHLEFENIGTVKLKGFDEPRTALPRVLPRDPDGGASPRGGARRAGSSARASRCSCCSPGGADSVCLLDVAMQARGAGLGAARELRPARGGRRRRAPSAAASASGWACRWRSSACRLPPEGNLQAAGARRCATRSPSVTPRAALTPPATRPATRPRPCSIASPCRPAAARCCGMAARRGRLVRPLLEVTREETRAYLPRARARMGEDVSNVDPRFARARVRNEVLPVLRELSPAAEHTIVETSRLLARRGRGAGARRSDEVLARSAADEALPSAELRAAAARSRPARAAPARGAARPAAGTRSRARTATRSWLSASAAARRSTSAGGCARVSEYGTLRFTRAPDAPRSRNPSASRCRAARASAPGRCEAALGAGGEVTLAADAVGVLLHGPRLARGRPHAPGRPRRQQVAPGPVHRPQGPPRAAPAPSRSSSRTARSCGWRGWLWLSGSKPRQSKRMW